jgi:hypothetical protein
MSETKPLFNIGDCVYDRIYRTAGTVSYRQEHKGEWLYQHDGLVDSKKWVYERTLVPEGCMYAG